MRFFVLFILCSLLRSFTCVNFGGRQFSDEGFRTLKNTVKCWSDRGKWTLIGDFVYDKTVSQMKNYEKFAPCIQTNTNNLNAKDKCYHLPEGNAVNYVWQANDCSIPFERISGANWCKFTSELRNILLIGDSLTAQYTPIAVMDELAKSLNDQSFCSKIGNIGCKYNVSCSTLKSNARSHFIQVSSVRNDKLSLITEAISSKSFIEYPFIDFIGQVGSSLLIMNRGSHYVEDMELIRELNITLHEIYRRYPQSSIIYRNTPYGHNTGHAGMAYKEFFDPPLKEAQNTSTILNMFNYHDFERQNKLVEEFIEKEFPQIIFFDAFTPTVLRVDSHINYLHYCYGAPALTNWVKFIYNILLLVAKHGH